MACGTGGWNGIQLMENGGWSAWKRYRNKHEAFCCTGPTGVRKRRFPWERTVWVYIWAKFVPRGVHTIWKNSSRSPLRKLGLESQQLLWMWYWKATINFFQLVFSAEKRGLWDLLYLPQRVMWESSAMGKPWVNYEALDACTYGTVTLMRVMGRAEGSRVQVRHYCQLSRAQRETQSKYEWTYQLADRHCLSQDFLIARDGNPSQIGLRIKCINSYNRNNC